MNEHEFRKVIHQNYREHFGHFHALHRFAENAMVNYRGFTANAYVASLQLIFPRAFKSFDSVRRLCEVALCEDAAVILRSLLNLLAVTRWISLDPEKRASRYFAWYWIQMHRDMERYKGIVPPYWITTIQERYAAVKPQFEYKDAKGRTSLAEHWYQPEARNIRDLFAKTELEQQYVEGYRLLSGVEHSDATAYFAMLATMEKKGRRASSRNTERCVCPPLLAECLPVLRRYFSDLQQCHPASGQQQT